MYIPWQTPVITEREMYQQLSNNKHYLGFPWATVIDRRVNLSNIYLEGENRSLNIFKNYNSLYKIYKSNFNLSNLSILKIYVLLFFKSCFVGHVV